MKVAQKRQRLSLDRRTPSITESQIKSARIHAAHYVTDDNELREVIQMLGEADERETEPE